MTADESLSNLFALFKRLLVHDEVLLARQLLDCAPWDLRERPELADMRRLVDVQLAHVDRPEEYWRLYDDYGIAKETIPMPWPILPEYSQHARFEAAMRLVRERLAKGITTVLDVGSYDGWLTNRVGAEGASAYGVDASWKMVELASAKADEFGTGARHALCKFGTDPFPRHFPQEFDVVLCMEVYEHVADTLSLLAQCKERVAPGGCLMVSTPHGSWLRGVQVPYGPSWDAPHAREHVRAPTPTELAADLRAVGFSEVNVTSVPVGHPPVCEPIPGQATLIGIAR